MAANENGIGVRNVNGRHVLTAYKIVDGEQVNIDLADDLATVNTIISMLEKSRRIFAEHAAKKKRN